MANSNDNAETSNYSGVLDNIQYKLKDLLFVKVSNLQNCFKLRISFGGWKPDLLIDKLSVREEKLLICSTCHGVMRDAVFNGKVSTCEVCVSVEGRDTAFDNDTAREIINELQIKCPLAEEGCNWIGAIETLITHFPSCLYYPVPCPLECTVIDNNTAEPVITTLPLHEVKSHVTETCPNRQINCNYCDAPIKAVEMNIHLWVCKEFPLVCPNKCIDPQSGEITPLKRGEIPHHIDSFCPNVEIDCPYLSHGCNVKLLRKNLATHEQDSMPQHLSLMSKYLEEKDCKINTLQNQLTNYRKQFENDCKKMENDRKQIENDRRLLENNRKQLESDRKQLEIDRRQLESDRKNDHKILNNKEKEVKITNNNLNHKSVNQDNLKFTTNEFTIGSSFDWTISNILDEISKKSILNSPYFYARSYKFYCVVEFQTRTNGDFGFYAHITKGDYDDTLKWPFTGKYQFSLVNHNDNTNNYFKEMRTDNTKMECFKKPSSEDNYGWGLKDFIKCSELVKEGKYRKNNSIMLKFCVCLNVL